MYTEKEIDTRSKKNVRDNGEVFTPFAIVDKMNNMIPDSAWNDPEYVFLEPTCGNGQFLVKIFEKRINHRIDILTTLNTLIGMDISQENILESHTRLYERVCSEMRVKGIRPQSKEWFEIALQAVAIVRNNIFKVKDSLAYIADGKLDKKKFFSIDPTGNNQVLTETQQKTEMEKIRKAFRETKNNTNNSSFTLPPFFEGTEE